MQLYKHIGGKGAGLGKRRVQPGVHHTTHKPALDLCQWNVSTCQRDGSGGRWPGGGRTTIAELPTLPRCWRQWWGQKVKRNRQHPRPVAHSWDCCPKDIGTVSDEEQARLSHHTDKTESRSPEARVKVFTCRETKGEFFLSTSIIQCYELSYIWSETLAQEGNEYLWWSVTAREF